jgi:hypothetical protein
VTFAAYQTVVTSLVAVVAVVFTVCGAAFVGTPAHVEVLAALLVSAEYAVAVKPPAFTMRYPHVPFASAVGVPKVPACGVIVFAPLVRLAVASEALSLRLYPVVRFVFTVTVSLALLTTPPTVGVKLIATVPDVVILMTSAMVALIAVLEVWTAAEAATGVTATAIAAREARMRFVFICLSHFFIYRCMT